MSIRIFITVIGLSLLLGLVLDVPVLLQAAVSIDDFSASTNDRFANDSAFIGEGYDFSGVGRAENGRWVTLITPNIFLTAQHYPPLIDEEVAFFRQNDPSETPVTRGVTDARQLMGSDLRIGSFDRVVPLSIADYGFSLVALTASNFDSLFKDRFAFQVGQSPTTSGYGADMRTNMAVGQNRVEDFELGLSEGGSTGDVFALIHNQPDDAGYIYEQYETELNIGDSGGPVFLVEDGQLEVAGIAWSKGEVEIESGIERIAGYYTYTGNLASQINDYIATHVQTRLPGDYDVNGIVDAADFTLWRDNLGSTTQLDADGNRNGIIDQADYDLWLTHFGDSQATPGSAPSALVTSAVPEPASLLGLLLLGVFFLAALRQYRLCHVEAGKQLEVGR